MKISHFYTRPPRVEMLPLIDIVFLLLVVFIYTMLSMAVHKGIIGGINSKVHTATPRMARRPSSS